MAQMKLAKFGSVDMDFVLGVGGYDLDRLADLSCVLILHIVISIVLCFRFLHCRNDMNTLNAWIGRVDSEVQVDSSCSTTHHHETEKGVLFFLFLSLYYFLCLCSPFRLAHLFGLLVVLLQNINKEDEICVECIFV